MPSGTSTTKASASPLSLPPLNKHHHSDEENAEASSTPPKPKRTMATMARVALAALPGAPARHAIQKERAALERNSMQKAQGHHWITKTMPNPPATAPPSVVRAWRNVAECGVRVGWLKYFSSSVVAKVGPGWNAGFSGGMRGSGAGGGPGGVCGF